MRFFINLTFVDYFLVVIDGSNNKEVVKPTSSYKQGGKHGPPRQYRNDMAELTMDNFEPKGEYFEAPRSRQMQREEEEEEEEDRGGRPQGKSGKGKSRGYATEVHDLTERPPKKHQPPKKYKPDNHHHHSGEYGPEFDDFHDDYPIVPYAPTSSGKEQNYNVGKSSSTVSQTPRGKGYKSSKKSPPPDAKPKSSTYKKVSYQGVNKPYDANYGPAEDDYGSSAATLLEYEPSASAQAAANSDHCKKVEKQADKSGRYKRQSMDCYVCQDPITKISSEECTYASDTAPQAYYKSASNSYNQKRPDNYRHKRYSGGEGDEDPDPYTYVKAASQQYNSRPKEFDGKNYKPKEAETESVPDYRYKPNNKYFSTDSDAKKKSFSEQKADELIQKGGENCEKVQREEMTCVVCVSAETGGNYEQCSYSSAPAQQKYAYVREQKFDGPVPTSKNEEASSQKSQPTANDDEKAQGSTKEEVVQPRLNEYEEAYRKGKLKHKVKEEAKRNNHKKDQQQQQQQQQQHQQQQQQPQQQQPQKQQKPHKPHQHHHHHHHHHHGHDHEHHHQKKPVARTRQEAVQNRGNSKYQVPQHFETETKNQKVQKPAGRGLDPKLYGSSAESAEKEEQKKSDEDHDHDYYPSEYHFKYFPDFLKEEEESKAEESQVVETQKKDVEEVLAEFAKKDRSKCQKAEKNGMTCYLCADENGLQHEECMYISESKPTNTHVAYHQKHELPQKTTAAPVTAAPAESREEATTPATSSEEPKPAASNVEPVRVAAAEKMIEKIKQKATKAAYATEQKNRMFKLPKVPKKYRPMKTKELTAAESRKEEQGNQEAEPEKEEEKEAAAPEEEAEEEEEEVAEEQGEKQNQKGDDKKEAKDEDPEKNSEPKEPETPQEFKVGEKEGAFSDETQPVYSKALGITLPKYMLTKSESETVFDEFVKASS